MCPVARGWTSPTSGARARRNVVPVMAIGVAELKRELKSRGGLTEFPEIHQFLDGFYLSRIGIRILIGQHIALHEPQKENHIGARRATAQELRPSPKQGPCLATPRAAALS